MKIKLEVEVEVPNAEELAEITYSHIYENDYYEDDDVFNSLYDYIFDWIENGNWKTQIPHEYIQKYENKMNKLKQ